MKIELGELQVTVKPAEASTAAPSNDFGVPNPPDYVKQFCAAESEPWAAKLLIRRACELFQEHGAWRPAYAALVAERTGEAVGPDFIQPQDDDEE